MPRRLHPHGDRNWLVGIAAVALLTGGFAARAGADQGRPDKRHKHPTTTVACEETTTTTSTSTSSTTTTTTTTTLPGTTDTTAPPPCDAEPAPTSDAPEVSTTPSGVTTTLAADSASTAPESATSAAATTTTEPDVGEPQLPPTPPEDWPVRPISFPVAGPVTYYDDWGACRGGPDCPRRHIGNDLIGQRLQPLLAARDGVVTHLVLNHPTAGWGLVITDADGWEYRYYHVNDDTPGTDDGTNPVAWRFAPGIAEGAAVKAGQVVAYVGDSGNAELSVPHLHFEIHQPDGSPIDPYRSLRFSEFMARCSAVAPGLQQESGMMPPVNPGLADAVVHTTSGLGTFLLSLDGSVLALGDARTVGWSRHAAEDPACPPPVQPAPTG
jgi:murein DD-endopeptidase MepM/ murein hydrolase activator NlpD